MLTLIGWMTEVTLYELDTELELRSVTTTSLLPASELGTTNVVENDPTAFVLLPSVKGRPAKVAVMGEKAAKPLPLIVTVEFTRPKVGPRLMLGMTV